MIRYLTFFNIVVSFFVWMPAWHKILKTHSAKDYSLLTLGIVFYLQCSNLGIAVAEQTWNLAAYLLVNAVIVGVTLWMVRRYQ